MVKVGRKPPPKSSGSKGSSKSSKQKDWDQGHTPMSTQLPSPAMEEDTPVAASNISSKAYGKSKDSPSTKSKISSIETAVPAPTPSY